MAGNMTYRELKEILAGYTEDELDLDVSVYIGDVNETWEIGGHGICGHAVMSHNGVTDGVLDDGHPFLIQFGDC